MQMKHWIYDDGGRQSAGFKGDTGDCAARAAAIVLRKPYVEVYDALNEYARAERPRGKTKRSNARTGVHARTLGRYLSDKGMSWHSCMTIGSGCQTHVTQSDLPAGRLVLRLSRHFAAWVDGTLCDTHDSSRDGSRCVYGYWALDEACP